MPKRVNLALTLLALTACFLSYKFGSAPVAHAQALPTAPTTWSLSNEVGGVNGAGARVTRAAGGSGVKHVATCIAFSMQNGGTTSAKVAIALWDGTIGTGQIVFEQYPLVAPGTSIVDSVCDLNIVGSANTPMALDFTSDTTTLAETVNLVGYDAQ